MEQQAQTGSPAQAFVPLGKDIVAGILLGMQEGEIEVQDFINKLTNSDVNLNINSDNPTVQLKETLSTTNTYLSTLLSKLNPNNPDKTAL
jgi:hypothetical protein